MYLWSVLVVCSDIAWPLEGKNSIFDCDHTQSLNKDPDLDHSDRLVLPP